MGGTQTEMSSTIDIHRDGRAKMDASSQGLGIDPEFYIGDDLRRIELSSLVAIFPEIRVAHNSEGDQYAITIDLPVHPVKTVKVSFPAALNGHRGPDKATLAGGAALEETEPMVDSCSLEHLPPLHVEIVLDAQYPAQKPPRVAISSSPPWLPAATARRLEGDAPRLWEEAGQDSMVYNFLDQLLFSGEEDVFGLLSTDDAKSLLEIDPAYKIALLDHDIRARLAAFEKKTFDCQVCLDPKKGAVCHRMLDCGHVFCVVCLQDFYNAAIQEGNLSAVRCLWPNCAKDRKKKQELGDQAGKKKRKLTARNTRFLVSPGELLQIPIEREIVKRYVALKYKMELEADKNTMYCPRSWCGGAARSKHRRGSLSALLSEMLEDKDEDENDGECPDAKKVNAEAKDRLAICEDCSFAFCGRCMQSWHGEFVACRSRKDVSADEELSREYLRHYSTPCPTCSTRAQKTHGCNHMICYRCDTHFCYLCAQWLDPTNPYQHFNEAPGGKKTACYMRLWELEDGDGEGQREPTPVRRPARQIQELREPLADDEIPLAFEVVRTRQRGRNGNAGGGGGGGGVAGPVVVAREAPLVLRIDGGGPAPASVPVQPGVAAGAGRGQSRGGAQAGGQRGGRPAGRARGVATLPDEQNEGAGPELNPAQVAWIQRFVQLALEDEEGDEDAYDLVQPAFLGGQ